MLEDGYYRFSETGMGCKPLAVMGTSLDEINAFFRRNSQRGIDNTIAEMPDIYMGYSTYAGVRFGRSLRPVADVSMNLFDSVTQIVPIASVITNAAAGSFALNVGRRRYIEVGQSDRGAAVRSGHAQRRAQPRSETEQVR